MGSKESEIDMRLKSLGKYGDIPQVCPLCQTIMANRGWCVSGKSVTCYSCNNMFEIEKD